MKAEIEVVRFDSTQIIATSGCTAPAPVLECATCYGSGAGDVGHS